MSLPSDIMPSSRRELEDRKENGWALTEHMRLNLTANGYDCSKAKEYYDSFDRKVTYAEWLDGVMVGYEDYLNKGASLKDRLKIGALRVASNGSSFTKYNFPHATTADQSYFIDQAMAYVGLGFRQGKLMIKDINRSNQ